METRQQKQIRKKKNFYHNFTYSFKVHGEEEALKTLYSFSLSLNLLLHIHTTEWIWDGYISFAIVIVFFMPLLKHVFYLK